MYYQLNYSEVFQHGLSQSYKSSKLSLVYFSIDKTTCIVETKKIRRKESGEAFSDAGPESGAKVTLRTNGKLLDAMVIASHGELFFLMFVCFKG